MKMAYQKTVSNKNMHTGQIDTHRFFADKDIDITNLDPLAKQRLMNETTKDLHNAIGIMQKQIILDNPHE